LTQITILPILSALGLFPDRAYEPFGTDAIEWSRAFRGGNYVPFCANLIVEKLRCTDEEYVRVLNNQVPSISVKKIVVTLVPLEGCGDGPSGFSDGLCEVESNLIKLSIG
jgi:acid phosphatase